MDGSNGNVRMLELLERIAASIDGNNQRVDGLTHRVDGLAQRLDRLTDRVENGFASVNGRLDNALVFMGQRHGDHEQRIKALEKSVFKKRKPD